MLKGEVGAEVNEVVVSAMCLVSVLFHDLYIPLFPFHEKFFLSCR